MTQCIHSSYHSDDRSGIVYDELFRCRQWLANSGSRSEGACSGCLSAASSWCGGFGFTTSKDSRGWRSKHGNMYNKSDGEMCNVVATNRPTYASRPGRTGRSFHNSDEKDNARWVSEFNEPHWTRGRNQRPGRCQFRRSNAHKVVAIPHLIYASWPGKLYWACQRDRRPGHKQPQAWE